MTPTAANATKPIRGSAGGEKHVAVRIRASYPYTWIAWLVLTPFENWGLHILIQEAREMEFP